MHSTLCLKCRDWEMDEAGNLGKVAWVQWRPYKDLGLYLNAISHWWIYDKGKAYLIAFENDNLEYREQRTGELECEIGVVDAVACIPVTLFGTEMHSPSYTSVGCYNLQFRTLSESGSWLKDAAIAKLCSPLGTAGGIRWVNNVAPKAFVSI